VLDKKRIAGAIGLAAAMVFLMIPSAHAWWNDRWQYRNKIGFNTAPTGADIKSNLSEIPILIRLHSGNFNFANTQEKGDDIRFTAADDKTLLKHHIEKYDPIDEIAYIWVKVPQLSGGVTTDFIWMYYGNKAAAGGQDGAGTYDAGQAAVYHLAELEGGPRDAAAFNNHIADYAGGQGLPAVIGGGMAFSGGGDRLTIPPSPTLQFADAFTFSTWIRIMQPQNSATLFQRKGQGASSIDIQVSGTKVCFQIAAADGQIFRTTECPDLSPESWHHIAFTAKSKGRMAIYMDGLELYYIDLPIALPAADGPITVGAGVDGAAPFVGDLDEIQLSPTERSADWLRAAFKSQGPEAGMVSVGPPELGGVSQLAEFYMTTVQVVRNITLDGWVIIGAIFVMGIGCTVVFLNKTYGLWLASKENKLFAEKFSSMDDPLAKTDTAGTLANSNLFRIFDEGCAIFKSAGEKAKTSAELELKAFKATLEKSYVNESKRLNAGMLMLTMSITGAPFLGLLGTVWGVMSTFAAMAEAGEANIAAIAPGVASALATTVAGLLVAIPALFAYNYLLSGVKSISADILVFIDQFTVKMETTRGGGA
jgi:biopolymer transport protein ExbB